MRKIASIGFIAANILAAALLIWCRSEASVAGNAAMLFCLGIIALDLLYIAFSKNRFGLWFIVGEIALLLLCHYPRQAASTDLGNMTSVSVVAAVAMIAMPLLAVPFFVLELRGIGRDAKPWPTPLRQLRPFVAPALLVGLLALAFLGYDSVYNYGYSAHEFTTTRADYLLLGVIFMVSCLFLNLFIGDKEGTWREYLRRNIALLTVFAALSGFGLSCFLRSYTSVKGDAAAAEQDYAAMFGESSADYDGDARAVPLSLPELLFGIRNDDNYTIEFDKVYTTIDEGPFAGLRLAYDAYLPADPGAHRSAVVMLHGSGQDKSGVDTPQRNKYLASKGYAVYTLQVGDWNEANTNYPKDVPRDWEFMLGNLDRFFAYATEHEDANFDSVFLMGSSMGGFLLTDYLYNFEHKYQEYGVKIRGLVPLYGVNGNAEIDSESLPALIYVGDHDGYVNVGDVYALREKYREAGNKNAIALTVSYGGHSCDIEFNSRGGQLEIYFLERFFGKLR